MFPLELDGATVLYYTDQDDYGKIKYTNGYIFDNLRYFAICKYLNSESYCLFGCNENYEVVSDSIWNSIDECMRVAAASYNENIRWYEIK